ncbi:MAG TPA: DUF4082 domain-containing protein [Bryobacteraceae bacterium]|nr:DUF4082 domain-containing protein [Bryobacteraceae bacterium]
MAGENLLPENTRWTTSGYGDPSFQGFATGMSINAGETVLFNINTDAASYQIDIYRLGYYGGDGARKITTIRPSVSLPHIQPPCLTDGTTKLVDREKWSVAASWDVPSTAVSGIYLALLRWSDTKGASHIIFVVRNDASQSEVLFKTANETWQDEYHDGEGGSPDLGMEQATINLPAYTSVQASTSAPLLKPATQSIDTAPPTSTFTSLLALQYGVKNTISGSALDSEGVVAGVEVSVDQGQTWHQAKGHENWTYDWTPYSLSEYWTVLVRAFDDSGNVQTIPTSAVFRAVGVSTTWSDVAKPDLLSDETKPIELGMKFRSDVTGYVTAVRFYKSPQNTGTHVGSLWSADGTRLASVTFVNETNIGWQQALFPSPIRIAANTTYVISYYAPNGGYAASIGFFKAGVSKTPLHVLADEVDGPNGIFVYAEGGGFPDQTYQASNYWVDVVLLIPSGEQHRVALSWTASTSTNVIGYNLYRTTTSGKAYIKLNTSPIASTTYVDNDVISGVTYFYTATAVDPWSTESALSNEVKVELPTP